MQTRNNGFCTSLEHWSWDPGSLLQHQASIDAVRAFGFEMELHEDRGKTLIVGLFLKRKYNFLYPE